MSTNPQKLEQRDDKVEMATLLWEVETAGFGGNELLVADLDGDGGDVELVTRQSPGQLRSQLNRDRGWNTDAERRIHCITAMDLRGNRLWQVGEPHAEDPPFCGHGEHDFRAADLNGDGLPEVLAIVWDTLTAFDGRTGQVLSEFKLPTDNFSLVKTGAPKGDQSRQQVLVKVNDKPYPPYEYSNPTYVLDSDLSELWIMPHYSGAGHFPTFLDVDKDGCDELLIGYNLVDHDGTLLWTIPIENATAEHADHILPADLNDDGRLELAYSGSKDFFVASLDGEILWRRPHTHSQKSVAGRLRDDVDGLTLILTEKWIGSTCYTPDGEALWSQPIVGDAFHRVSGWRKDGLDLVTFEPKLKASNKDVPFMSNPDLTPDLWPYLMDGEGNRAVEFPWKEDYVQRAQQIRSYRGYDHGIGFRLQLVDLNGDGVDEIVVWDRNRVMAFGPPA